MLARFGTVAAPPDPDTAPSGAITSPELADLERRLAAFDNATQRLEENINAAEAKVGESSRGSSSKRRAVPLQAPAQVEEISGLRPAVVGPTPVTGALTARRRSDVPAQVGFTSAHGRPNIPAAQAPAPPAPGTAITTSRKARPTLLPAAWRWHLRWAIPTAVAGLLLLALLPRMFPVLSDAAVWASTERICAAEPLVVGSVSVRIGDRVRTGQPLLTTGDGSAAVLAGSDGIVVRLAVAPGARVARGELLAEVAHSDGARVVAVLSSRDITSIGDRVSVQLISENRIVDGSVESVLDPGAPGPWQGRGPPPLRAVILLDPSANSAQLGQGARITVIGQQPGAGRMLLYALRRMLP